MINGQQSIPTKEPKSKLFYERLKKSGTVKGLPDDYAVFESAMQDSVKRQKFYDRLSGSGAVKGLPEYEKFEGIFQAQAAGNEETHGRAPVREGAETQKQRSRNPLVNFGQTFWNVLSKQLPSTMLAGGVAATPDTPDPMGFAPDPVMNPFQTSRDAVMARLERMDQDKATGGRERIESRQRMLSEALQGMEDFQTAQEGAVTTTDQINDSIDLLNWVANSVAQAAAQIPASILSGGATSVGQEIGIIYMDQVGKIAEKEGITPEEVIERGLDDRASAVAYGAFAGALDRLGAGVATKVIPIKDFRSDVANRALSFVRSAVTEGVTESSQSAIEQFGASRGAGDSVFESLTGINLNDVVQEGLAGAVGGGGINVAVQVRDAVANRGRSRGEAQETEGHKRKLSPDEEKAGISNDEQGISNEEVVGTKTEETTDSGGVIEGTIQTDPKWEYNADADTETQLKQLEAERNRLIQERLAAHNAGMDTQLYDMAIQDLDRTMEEVSRVTEETSDGSQETEEETGDADPELEEIEAQWDAQEKKVEDFIKKNNESPFEAQINDDISIVVSKETDGSGKWRVTSFNQGEPAGHTTFDSYEKAVSDAAWGFGADLDNAKITKQEEPKTPEGSKLGLKAPDVGTVNQEFQNAPKAEGRKVERTLESGEVRDTQFMVVPLDDILASHNETNFNQTEGYPVLEDGRTPNDNDYKNSQEARERVEQISKNLDGRVFENIPTISTDGIVVDGNNRTMSIKKAKNNNNKRWQWYQNELRNRASEFGIDPAAIEGIENPVLVRVDHDVKKYDTDTYAKYNIQPNKEKSDTDRAVIASKKIDAPSLQRLTSFIDFEKYNTINEALNDRKTGKEVIDLLQNLNLISANERVRFYDAKSNSVTPAGKNFVSMVARGSLLSEQALRNSTVDGVRQVSNAIETALPILIKIRANHPDFDISAQISEAINAERTRADQGLSVDELYAQQSMFSDMNLDKDTALMHFLMKKGPANFKRAMEVYLKGVESNSGSGLFETEQRNRDQLLDDVISYLENKYEGKDEKGTLQRINQLQRPEGGITDERAGGDQGPTDEGGPGGTETDSGDGPGGNTGTDDGGKSGSGSGSTVRGNTGRETTATGEPGTKGKIPESKPKKGQRPPLVYATKERITAPPEHIKEDTYPILDEHQRFGVNMALERYANGGKGFLLADGTGVGKTMQILAIADQLQKQGKGDVLIVTENAQVIENFKKDGQLVGIDADNFGITTYSQLSSNNVDTGKNYHAVLFDEAHNLKNPDSKKTMVAKQLKANHILFATATPMDTLSGITYFAGTVTNKSPEEIYRQLGFVMKMRTDDKGNEIPGSGYWVLGEGVTVEQARDNVLQLRDEMIEAGGMLRREYPHYGEVIEEEVTASAEAQERELAIDDYWENQVYDAMNEDGYIHPKKKMSLMGQRSGELSRANEIDKLPEVQKRTLQSLKEGKSVVIIAEGVNNTHIKGTDEVLPGFLTEMMKFLDNEGVAYSKIFGSGDKASEVAKFQDGRVKVALATPKSGSTGINLDDTKGDSPRVMYVVTPNYSGNVFDQILGRVSRRNTASPADVHLMFNDSMSDSRRKEIVRRKLQTVKAIQKGKLTDEDAEIGGVKEEATTGSDNTGTIDLEEVNRKLSESDIELDTYGKTYIFKGNTKPIKDVFKRLGGRWHGKEKGWMFPQSNTQVVQRAIDEVYDWVGVQETNNLYTGKPTKGSSTGAFASTESKPGSNPTKKKNEISVTDKTGSTHTVELGHLDKINGMAMPELVRLVRDLTGEVPTVSTRMRNSRGLFYPVGNGKIRLKKEIFEDTEGATKTLAHEIGHLFDYMPDKLMTRGNLIGRVKSLISHLKQTAETNDSTGPALTQKDRNRLRNLAKKTVIKESGATLSQYIDDKALQDQLREKISKRYQEYVKEEIRNRKLLSNPELFEELYAHSKSWRPFDESTADEDYIRYRRSSEELYADALSALLVSPGTLEENAPTFYKAFFDHLNEKPKVKQLYLETQALLNGGDDAVRKLRNEFIETAAMEAEAKTKQLLEEREQRAKRKGDALKQDLVNKWHPVLKKIREAEKAGKVIPAEKNPKYILEELDYKDNVSTTYLYDVGDQVVDPIEKAGMTTLDLHKYLLFNRVANEKLEISNKDEAAVKEFLDETDKAIKEDTEKYGRAFLANPGGLTEATANEQLDFMKKELGDEKFKILEKAAKSFQELNFQAVEEAVELGVYNKELFEKIIEPNKYNYATFRVLDYIEYPDYVTAAIKESKGTFKDIGSTFDATLLKTLALINTNQVQKGKLSFRDTWFDLFPEEIEKAKQVAPGRFRKEADKGHFKLYEDGKIAVYNVDPYIAEAFEMTPKEFVKSITDIVRWINESVYRPLFITYNPAFVFWSNPNRDFKRFYKNMPEASLGRALKSYIDSWKDARDYAKGNLKNERVRRLVDEFAVVPPGEGLIFKNRGDALGRQMQRFHLAKEKGKASQFIEKHATTRWVPKLLEWMREAGSTLEIMPKLAADRILQAEGVEAKQRAYRIRNYFGTPNFKAGGQAKNTTNSIYMFSNIIIQGYKADMEIATNPQARGAFWFRTAMIDILPKLLIRAAVLGWFGKKLKEFYDRVTEYDKTNYVVIPLGFSEGGTTGKKSNYLRIPQDETGRLISGAIWKLTGTLADDPNNDWHNLFDIGADELPSPAPIIQTLSKWGVFLSGANPTDDWRDRPILPQRVQDARKVDELPAIKKMVEWTINQTGLTNIATYNPDADSWNEFILQTAPILNRAIKSSDYGLIETQNASKELEEAKKAATRLGYGDEVLKLVGRAAYLRNLGDKRMESQDIEYSYLNNFYQQVYRPMDEWIRFELEEGDKEAADKYIKELQEYAEMYNAMIEEENESKETN